MLSVCSCCVYCVYSVHVCVCVCVRRFQVCTAEFKNVMLPCLHMFCKGCIDKQIKTRNRKCPSCNLRFDADSVKKIVFT